MRGMIGREQEEESGERQGLSSVGIDCIAMSVCDTLVLNTCCTVTHTYVCRGREGSDSAHHLNPKEERACLLRRMREAEQRQYRHPDSIKLRR